MLFHVFIIRLVIYFFLSASRFSLQNLQLRFSHSFVRFVYLFWLFFFLGEKATPTKEMRKPIAEWSVAEVRKWAEAEVKLDAEDAQVLEKQKVTGKRLLLLTKQELNQLKTMNASWSCYDVGFGHCEAPSAICRCWFVVLCFVFAWCSLLVCVCFFFLSSLIFEWAEHAESPTVALSPATKAQINRMEQNQADMNRKFALMQISNAELARAQGKEESHHLVMLLLLLLLSQ